MPQSAIEITPEQAYQILLKAPHVRKKAGSKVYAVLFPGQSERAMAIRKVGPRDALTVYVNSNSTGGLTFDTACLDALAAGTLRLPPPKQARGDGIGISNEAARFHPASLLPSKAQAKPLLMHVTSKAALETLLRWYTADVNLSAAGAVAEAVAAPSSAPVPVGNVGGGPTSGPTGAQDEDEKDDSGAGRMADAKLKKLIENCAVDAAIAVYEELGYRVISCGDMQSYDLECHPTAACTDGSQVVHVEVKGTQKSPWQVTLTANEVEHARAATELGYRCDLFIMGDIMVPCDPDAPEAKATASALTRVHHEKAWVPMDEDLQPTQFRYRVPRV